MVTVRRTLTEHTNGRRQKQDGTGWERRAGTRKVEDGKRGRYPRMETVWEDCEAPVTVDYNSDEHKRLRESGRLRGGEVKYVIEGLPETLDVVLTGDEVDELFRGYVHKFSRMTYIADGGKVLSTTCEATASEAMREARRIADRVQYLFGIDLWTTNLVDC